MVTQINAVYQLLRFMLKRLNGAAWEAKFVGNGNMLVISQPSKVKTKDGSPIMCSTCSRINDSLLLPERDPRQMELDLENKVRNEKGRWACSCTVPRQHIGSPDCLKCGLPV